MRLELVSMVAAIATVFCISAGAKSPELAPTHTGQTSDPRLGELLAPLPDDEYTEQRYCLPGLGNVNAYALDSGRVVFVDRKGDIWLNQLTRSCAGLAFREPLLVQRSRTRVCRSDRFSPMRFGSTGLSLKNTSAACTLGRFEKISPEQLNLLMRLLASS